MDGVEIHDPYRLFGLTSAFNPETSSASSWRPAASASSTATGCRRCCRREPRRPRATRGWTARRRSASPTPTSCSKAALPGGRDGLVAGDRPPHLLRPGRRAHHRPGVSRLRRSAGQGGVGAGAGPARVTLFGLRSRQAAALEIDEDDARGEFQDDTENDLASLRFDTTLGTRGQSHTSSAISDTRSTFGVDAAFENTSQRSNAPDDDSIGIANVIFERGLGVRDLSLRQELVWALGAHVVETGAEVHRLSTAQRFEITGDRNPTAANGSSVQGGAGLPDLLESSRSRRRAAAPGCRTRGRRGAATSLQAGLRARPRRDHRRHAAVAAAVGHPRARRRPRGCERRVGPLHAEPRLREARAERLRARLHQRRGAARCAASGRGRRRRPRARARRAA